MEEEAQEVLGNNRTEDVSWLCSLSESELDMLISLKMLVIQRAKVIGRENLAEKVDLKMLRALGLILMEYLIGQFKGSSDFPSLAKSAASIDVCNLSKCGLDGVMSIEEIKACMDTGSTRRPFKRRKMFKGSGSRFGETDQKWKFIEVYQIEGLNFPIHTGNLFWGTGLDINILKRIHIWFMRNMGICGSCESRSLPVDPMTSKLILRDGNLQEVPYPVKVSQLLLHLHNNSNMDPTSSFFICNSDDMDFDDFLSAVGGDEVLQPGHLYFELPTSWLSRRLQAEDMASLAVKASVALKASHMSDGGRCFGCGCGLKRKVSSGIVPVVFASTMREVESGGATAAIGGGDDEREAMLRRRRRRRGGGRFSSNLGVILEE